MKQSKTGVGEDAEKSELLGTILVHWWECKMVQLNRSQYGISSKN